MFRDLASQPENSNLKEKGGKSLSLRNKNFPYGNSYSVTPSDNSFTISPHNLALFAFYPPTLLPSTFNICTITLNFMCFEYVFFYFIISASASE